MASSSTSFSQENVLPLIKESQDIMGMMCEDTKKISQVTKDCAAATNLNTMKSIAEFTESLSKASDTMQGHLNEVKRLVEAMVAEIEAIDEDTLGIE